MRENAIHQSNACEGDMDANMQGRPADLIKGLRKKIKADLAEARGVPINEVTEEMANAFADKMLRDLGWRRMRLGKAPHEC
jgi:hypothetical protein